MSFDKLSLYILGVAGAIGLLIALVEAVASLRDKLVLLGFLGKQSWVGRQLVRRKELAFKELLEQMGFTEVHRELIREAYARSVAADRVKAIDTRTIIEELFVSMKRCLVEEPNGRDFRPTTGKYFVDIMGASSALNQAEWEFALILAKWIHILSKEGKIPRFDAVLVPKNGNPTLVHHAMGFYSASNPPKVFVWKGFDDHSRVTRPNRETPHYLDFEGFWAYKQTLADQKAKLRVLALDDNFTSGSTLCTAIAQFNALVSNDETHFEPISVAVSLFCISSDDAEQTFRRVAPDFAVHTMISTGPSELDALSKMKLPQLLGLLAQFQTSFACKESKRLTS